MRKSVFWMILCYFLFSDLNAQNLVPNAGFEACNKLPTRWIGSPYQFDEWIEDWNSPNDGSPDILFIGALKDIRPLRDYVDLTLYQPHGGKIMLGIKTYGCVHNALHCREYIQAKLTETLVVGDTYYVEFWVRPTLTSILNNGIGMSFSTVEHQLGFPEGMYYEVPQVVAETVLSEQAWTKVSGRFVAEEPYTHLNIGNFYADGNTEILSTAQTKMGYAYYLIDDVLVRREKRLEDVEVGTSLVINNIFFETDKATLLPTSFAELDKIFSFLDQNTAVRIKILGHTDNVGDNDYNLQLSNDRAKAVADYLSDKGISKERLEYKGMGETLAVADNTTDQGRQQNRRVEMMILSK